MTARLTRAELKLAEQLFARTFYSDSVAFRVIAFARQADDALREIEDIANCTLLADGAEVMLDKLDRVGSKARAARLSEEG